MTTPTIVDPDLVEMMKSVFTAHRDDAADSAESAKFNPQLWRTLDELGLIRLTGSETHGGSGADWHAASALLSAAAAAAVPVPLVEHDLLSGWLLETAGLPMNGGLRTAFLLADSAASSVVPWARDAEFMVVLRRRTEASWAVTEVARADTTLTPSQNLAGEPRDRVTIDVETAEWTSVPDGVAETFVLRGALARTLQVCGAMERIVELCIDHVSSRAQFGRQLSKFQAVQRLVTGIATETALARSAADAAVASIERNGWDAPGASFAVAVAKSCAGHAASTVVRNAHQVHGAIGTTREHELHRYTRPVLSWRSEFGSVGQWDRLLTQTAVAAGRDGAWKLIVEGRPLSGVLDIAV